MIYHDQSIPSHKKSPRNKIVEDIEILPDWIGELAWYMYDICKKMLYIPKRLHISFAAAAISIATKTWEDDYYITFEYIQKHALSYKLTSHTLINTEDIKSSERHILAYLQYNDYKTTKECFYVDV